MAKIVSKNNEFTLYDFENEAEFEKAVIENKQYLFGKDSVYIDVKRLIGQGRHRGIPDGFLIDFYDAKKPQLYIVENEIDTHEVCSNITEQIARFCTSAISSGNQIRNILIKTIENKSEIKKEIEKYLPQTSFKTITELMLSLTENEIKTVIAINDISSDLNAALKIFKNQPDVVLLQRYMCKNEITYYYHPMREEMGDIEKQKAKTGQAVEFNTVVCAAFEEGFKHAYINNNAWWALRLSQEARDRLKYLAIYEKAPIAHIKHYAEIDSIEPYKDTGKYILYLKNKKTLKPIGLSGKKIRGQAPQSPRYTSINKLLKAKAVHELWG